LPNGKEINDHQQKWGYEDVPRKESEPPLLVAADFRKTL
jgi:hypothetical protein